MTHTRQHDSLVTQAFHNVHNISSMDLKHHVTSQFPCVLGQTYGYTNDVTSSVWVKDGCEGDFSVCYAPVYTYFRETLDYMAAQHKCADHGQTLAMPKEEVYFNSLLS